MDSESFIPTEFDLLTQSNQLQMLKTILPYIPTANQKEYALFIKCMEIKNCMDTFSDTTQSFSACSFDSPMEELQQLLTDIRPFCSENEKQQIDQLNGSIQTMISYEFLFGKDNENES